MNPRKPKSQNSLLTHSMYAVADIGNGPEVLKLYVEEMYDSNKPNTAKRDYQLQNIEKYHLTGMGSQNVVSPISPSNGIEYTVSDIFNYVKTHDASFTPKDASKIVDDDGKNDWEKWKTYLIDKNNTIWEAKLNIATSANGEKILYDIDPIKKVGQAGNSATSSPVNNVPQKSGNVNGQNNSQNNTPAFGRSFEEMRDAQNPGTEQTEATPSMKRADGGKTAEDWKSIAERINSEHKGIWRMKDFSRVLDKAYGDKTDSRIADLINRSEILYLDTNKNRAETWLMQLGVQLPSRQPANSSIGSIFYQDGKVNIKGKNLSELGGVIDKTSKHSIGRSYDEMAKKMLSAEVMRRCVTLKIRARNSCNCIKCGKNNKKRSTFSKNCCR